MLTVSSTLLQKKCETCGSVFTKPPTTGLPQWSRRKFCSRTCRRHTFTPEQIAEISARRFTPEVRAKMSASATKRGNCMTPERIAWLKENSCGEGNPNFKGADASYAAIHKWLERNYRKAGICEACGATRKTQWAYLGAAGGYERDRDMYCERCSSCHKLADIASPRVSQPDLVTEQL